MDFSNFGNETINGGEFDLLEVRDDDDSEDDFCEEFNYSEDEADICSERITKNNIQKEMGEIIISY